MIVIVIVIVIVRVMVMVIIERGGKSFKFVYTFGVSANICAPAREVQSYTGF